MAALFRHIGGSEIDGDALQRQSQTRSRQRGAHPLARFPDGFVGQTDDHEQDFAGRNLHLHIDIAGLDPLKGNSGDPHSHPHPSTAPMMNGPPARQSGHSLGRGSGRLACRF